MELQNYISPECIVVEIAHEGMLCLSGLDGGFSHEGIGGSDDEIFNN